MGIFLAIAAAIALGVFFAYVGILTFKWLKNKIIEKFNNRNVKKVAACTLEKLIDECPNEISVQDLQTKNFTHVVGSVDENGKVFDVDIIKNTGANDPQVAGLLGEKEMVVVKPGTI